MPPDQSPEAIASILAQFEVTGDAAFRLADCATRITRPYQGDAAFRRVMKALREGIADRQRKLFANGTDAVLVVVQGVDGAGKNGLVRHALRKVDPNGMHVWSFGAPDHGELREDFLRRYQRRLPLTGEIAVFNRGYHEVVLSGRVHPDSQVPAHHAEAAPAAETTIAARFEEIRAFERYLVANRIAVVKIMLHVSPGTQQRRLRSRADSNAKQWKLTEADCRDAALWSDFAEAYEACIANTATSASPWYVLPADDKRTARMLGAAAVLQALERLAPEWPVPGAGRKAELARMVAALSAIPSPEASGS